MTTGLHSRQLVVTDAPDRDDVQFIEDRIDEFNISHTGITDARLLSIVLRDDDDRIVAGVYGWTWGRCCEIRTLWVHEQLRDLGVGTRLMLTVQAEAERRGATQIVLSTHSFQAPDFYHRLGFEPVGVVHDYPQGHTSIHLRKRLHDAAIVRR